MLEKEEGKLARKRQKEEECRTELARRQKRLDMIHGRGGMRATFDNEEDYMAWLHQEIASVSKQVIWNQFFKGKLEQLYLFESAIINIRFEDCRISKLAMFGKF